MNHLETGVQAAAATADAAIAKPSSPATNDGLVWNGSTWVNAKLVNANIDPAAAIAYSKLQLAGSVVNNDIATAAAIALSKLADPGSGKVIGSLGSGAVAVQPPGTELAYAEITADATSTATSAATATTTVSAGSVSFDGTAIIIEFFATSSLHSVASAVGIWDLWDGATDLGVIAEIVETTAAGYLVYGKRKIASPSVGSHTYAIKQWSGTAGTLTTKANTGGAGQFLPAFIRITKA